jgi:hypothetical protein
MFPILLEIPGLGLPIKSFGLMVVLGFLLGAYVFDRLVARYAPDAEEKRVGYSAMPIWILIGILIGARVLYVLVEVLQGSSVGQSYLDHPWKVFAYWEGGLVMYGGTAGAIIGGLWCTKRHGLRSARTFDLGVVAAFTGLCIGRIGCLLVGDDYGRIVPPSFETAPFPLVLHVPDPLPKGSLFGGRERGHVLWATQVWMSGNALMLSWLGARHPPAALRRTDGPPRAPRLLDHSRDHRVLPWRLRARTLVRRPHPRLRRSSRSCSAWSASCSLWRNRGQTDVALAPTVPTSSP